MKNILFVGPYRQTDGWGNAAKEYVRALRETGYNIAVRPVYLNSQPKYDKLDEFDDLEKNCYDSYDVIIQNCLPNLFRKYGGVTNIGLSYFETTINSTPWVLPINLMDKMWVASSFEKDILKKSNPNLPVDVIPVPCDVEQYKEDYQYDEINRNHSHEIKFYFVGEMITRKNIESLVVAFNREFASNELVRLILKVNKVGMDDESVLQNSRAFINGIKKSLGFYPNPKSYRSEVIIPTFLKKEQLFGLHNQCDCFVMPSSGESFNLPTFDATIFGSYVLVNKNLGPNDYTNSNASYRVESYETPAMASDRPLPYLYNGRDTWYEISILDLQKGMRDAYNLFIENPNQKQVNKKHAIDNILPNYSYKSIAKKMVESL